MRTLFIKANDDGFVSSSSSFVVEFASFITNQETTDMFDPANWKSKFELNRSHARTTARLRKISE